MKKKNVTINKELCATGNIHFGSNIKVDKEVTVKDDLVIEKNVTINNELSVIGNVYFGSNIKVDGEVTIKGDFVIEKTSQLTKS